MRAPLKSHLLQEWRERRWQFRVGLAWFGAAVIGTLFFGLSQFPQLCFAMALPYCALMPILVAIHTACRKAADPGKTLSADAPIDRGRQASVRLAGGWLALISPLVIAAAAIAFYHVCEPLFEPESFIRPMQTILFLGIGLAAVLWLSTGLYLLLSVLGTWVRTEFRLGLTGIVATIVFAVVISLEFRPYPLNRISPALAIAASAVAPNTVEMLPYFFDAGDPTFKMVFGPHAGSAVVLPLAINLALQCAAAVVFVRRYARQRSVAADDRPSPAAAVNRRRTRALPASGAALVRLTLRQTLPICFVGLAVICVVALGEALSTHGSKAKAFGVEFPVTTGAVGVLWSAIIGAATFRDTAAWRRGESWQSWPHTRWRYVAIEYLTGLLVVLIVLDAVGFAAAWYCRPWGNDHAAHWAYAGCFLPTHAMVYSIAVAWSCYLRRAILAGLAACGSYVLIVLALWSFQTTANYEPVGMFEAQETWHRRHSYAAPVEINLAAGYAAILVASGLVTVGATAAGYLALSRSDGPRRWWRAGDSVASD